MTITLILASNSPRRRKILSDMGLEFEVVPSNYDEKLKSDKFSYEVIEDLATQKCLDVVKRIDKKALVLAADTVVVLHNRILGKPHTPDNAYKMLKELSGQTHSVVTSICAINTALNRAATISTTSYVRFTNWSEKMINDYITNYSPLDKAGSYGIQELPPNYIDKFEGSFENIVGLCPLAVESILKQLHFKPEVLH